MRKTLSAIALALNLLSNQAFADNIKIANWNLQVFGKTKASRPELMKKYSDVMKGYDIVFVQEIRDSSNTAFNKLCTMLPGYKHLISSKAGRTNSKEQYGILFRNNISARLKDFNPDTQNRWERPPVAVTFNINNYVITAYNIHTKPTDVPRELTNLENVIINAGNVMVLGDLNADCNYYHHNTSNQFNSWFWIIKDDDDTTTKTTNCAYDRFILNKDARKEFVRYGIVNQGITPKESDHYPVWIEMDAKDH